MCQHKINKKKNTKHNDYMCDKEFVYAQMVGWLVGWKAQTYVG